MAVFTPFIPSEYAVGKAVKKELWRKVADNFTNHEDRIAALSLGAAPIEVFNLDILNASSAGSFTGLLHHEAIGSVTITKVAIRIFEKGIVTSGVLEMDVKKGTSLDDLSMTSIMTTKPAINFATASDFDESVGVINPVQQTVAPGEFLRLDITSLPTIPLGKFRVLVYGVI
jgi:hypothetical protein